MSKTICPVFLSRLYCKDPVQRQAKTEYVVHLDVRIAFSGAVWWTFWSVRAAELAPFYCEYVAMAGVLKIDTSSPEVR